MHLDGAFDFHVVAGVDEEPVGNGSLMPGRELGGTEAGFLLHEVRRDEIAVRDERFGERQADHALREVRFGMNEFVVDEDELCGGFGEAGGAGDETGCGRDARATGEAVEVELFEIGEAPGFIAAFRRGRGKVAFPRVVLARGEPCGENGGCLGSGGGHGNYEGFWGFISFNCAASARSWGLPVAILFFNRSRLAMIGMRVPSIRALLLLG